jgi:hypothetical protein
VRARGKGERERERENRALLSREIVEGLLSKINIRVPF